MFAERRRLFVFLFYIFQVYEALIKGAQEKAGPNLDVSGLVTPDLQAFEVNKGCKTFEDI